MVLYIYPPWLDSPSGPRPSHCWGFEIRLRHTTLSRTPLDEWSTGRRALYLTTHNNHKRQTSIPLAGFETPIPVKETSLRTSGCRDQPYILRMCPCSHLWGCWHTTLQLQEKPAPSYEGFISDPSMKHKSQFQLITLPRGVHFFLRGDSSLSYQKICSRFIKPDPSLPCSHELATLWAR
jgi:hypothetical protein